MKPSPGEELDEESPVEEAERRAAFEREGPCAGPVKLSSGVLEITTGTVLHVEQPEPAVMAKLQAGLERSGMTFGECSFCGRPYGSREGSLLCPPCRGVVPYDGWHETHPDRSPFVQRSRLLALLMHRGSEQLAIARLADVSAEEGEPDVLALCDAALGGDEQAWKQALITDLLFQHPSLRGLIESIKSEVHVEVVAVDDRLVVPDTQVGRA